MHVCVQGRGEARWYVRQSQHGENSTWTRYEQTPHCFTVVKTPLVSLYCGRLETQQRQPPGRADTTHRACLEQRLVVWSGAFDCLLAALSVQRLQGHLHRRMAFHCSAARRIKGNP